MTDKITKPRLVPKVVNSNNPEKLPWPGLEAKDHLSRVVTRAVKAASEEKWRLLWSERQIARVLNRVSPQIALAIFFRELKRRGRHVPRIAYNLIDLF